MQLLILRHYALIWPFIPYNQKTAKNYLGTPRPYIFIKDRY